MHLIQYKGQKISAVFVKKQDALRSIANVLTLEKNAIRSVNV
jgi:hypothetical protein